MQDIEIQALVRLLESKGILTRQEFVDTVEEIREEEINAREEYYKDSRRY